MDIERIPINNLSDFNFQSQNISKYLPKNRVKLNEFELWKSFINHSFVQIKHQYETNDELNNLKWKLIIKYIIKTTCDFDFARLVKNNHEELYNFFKRYYNLTSINENIKHIKVSKQEKIDICKTDDYKDFEYCFSSKLELIKIICYIHQLIDYNYIKQISNESLNRIIKLNNDMDRLNIIHQDYEIYYQNSNYSNIRFKKYKQLEYNDINMNNLISTKILLFIFVNNLVDIRNLVYNKDNDIIISIPYYLFSISSIGQNSDKIFDGLVFYKTLFNDMIKRNDLINYIDEYMSLDLTGSQKIELDNIKKIINGNKKIDGNK